eukprot:jgi/Astpho2/9161/Aster-07805
MSSKAGPREVPDGMQEEAHLLYELCKVPTISRVWCRGAGALQLTVQQTQHNLASNAKRTYLRSVQVVPDQKTAVASLPVEQQGVQMMSVSPSGKRIFVVRAGTEGSSVMLEVWDSNRALQEFAVPKDLHGSVLNEAWFSNGAVWTPDESRAAASERSPEWGAMPNKSRGTADANGKSEQAGAKPKSGSVVEDWGETHTEKRPPAIFVLDLKRWHVKPVAGLPKDTSFAQPTWTPDAACMHLGSKPSLHKEVWASGSTLHERRGVSSLMQADSLGGSACHCLGAPVVQGGRWSLLPGPIRAPTSPPCVNASALPCFLYQVTVPFSGCKDTASSASQPESVCLTPGLPSAQNPTFTPDGTQLVFLSHAAAVHSGVHAATVALMSLPWSQDDPGKTEARTVVPVVQRTAAPEEFPGLYCSSLAQDAFLDNNTLLVITQWRSATALAAVDLTSGRVQRLGEATKEASSWFFAGQSAGWIAAITSSPSCPPQLHVAETSKGLSHLSWRQVPLQGSLPYDKAVQEALQNIRHTVLQVTATTKARAELPVEAILLHPAAEKAAPGPAILWSHGRPHHAFPRKLAAALCIPGGRAGVQGYAGFGEAALQSLPGNVGDHDVADCMAALDAAAKTGWINEKQVGAMGGSHGGFLTGHLLGQHPEAFCCGILQNPVLNIALMVHQSDITDWCFVETWGSQEGRKRATNAPTPQDMAHFMTHSPVRYISKIHSPMLYLLGAKDRRALNDAQQFIYALREQPDAPLVKTFVFPEDTHALDKPHTEFEQLLNIADWLQTHMKA